jgi:hypothetical protein
MTNDEIKYMVENYFDGELDKNEEPLLFTTLSTDIEAREYFKKLHALRSVVAETIEPFPVHLEENILTSIKTHEHRFYKNINFRSRVSHIISVAAAAVLFIFCSLLFLDVKDYKLKIAIITEQVKEQNETMNLILNNSLPAFVISPDTKNEIIVRAKLQ